jgi:hypothetical protein
MDSEEMELDWAVTGEDTEDGDVLDEIELARLQRRAEHVELADSVLGLLREESCGRR